MSNPGYTVDVVRRGERPRPYEPPPIPADPLAALSDAQRAALPNLIVIGAGKCGTSALHRYLSLHPDVGMSERKEMSLFGGARWIERLPLYADAFDASRPVRGESSPSYSMDPYVPSVPEQIAAVLPHPKFIYLVADPLTRVVAHWAEQRYLRLDRRALGEALADADNPLNPYVAASRYGHQLQRYVDEFGSDAVLVLDQSDLRSERRSTLRTVFEFVGVDPEFWTSEFEAEVNTADTKLQTNALGGWIEDRLGNQSSRRVTWSRIPHVTARRRNRPSLNDEIRARLTAVLAPDIALFRRLTGRPFAGWEI
ncbi:MAG: hypothetical protein QOF21_577 [Actinomycetota bacterium]